MEAREGVDDLIRSAVDGPDAGAPAPHGGSIRDALLAASAEIERLRRSYHEILDNANDIIYSHDLEGNFLTMNARGEQILGYRPDEIARMTIADILPRDQLEIARGKMRAKVDGDGPTTYELDVRTKGGDLVPLEVSTRVVTRGGAPVGVLGIARDVRERREAQRALMSSERRFRALIEHSGDVKMLLSAEGRVKYVSPAVERILGFRPEERVGKSIVELMSGGDAEQATATLAAVVREPGALDTGVIRARHRSGEPRWLAYTAHNLLHEPDVEAVVVNYRDITDRKRDEARLVELADFRNAVIGVVEESLQEGLNEAFYGRVLRAAVDVIPGAQAGSLLLKDDQARCHFVAAVGFDLDALAHVFLHERELHRDFSKKGAQVVRGFEPRRLEDPARSDVIFGAGRAAEIAVTLSIPVELDGEAVAYFHLDNFDDPAAFSDDAVGMAQVFSNHIATLLQRFRLEAELRQERAALDRMAYSDALTGLPNRNMFYRRAREARAAAEAEDRVLGVLFFDLDRFKELNDSRGHEFGDEVLAVIGKRLQGCVREGETVSRWGGDEFVILLPDARSARRAEALAERIIERVNAPISIEDEVVHLGCSIGIALASAADASVDDLTRNADIALYRAKAEGRNRHRVFNQSMRESLDSKLRLERELGEAITERAFELRVADRVDLSTGEVVAQRARLHWRHPTRGLLPPEAFVPVADESGAFEPIGDLMFELAAAHLRSASDGAPPISLELWPAQFRRDDLAERLHRRVDDLGIDPARVELVVPEATAMRGPASTHRTLRALRDHGFRLAVGEFGVTFTSVRTLQQLPFTTVVVDRRVVSDACVQGEGTGERIAASVVGLARGLELEVVADGYDDPSMSECLLRLGCRFGQGDATRTPGASASSSRS